MLGTQEMTQCLQALVTLPEDLRWVPKTKSGYSKSPITPAIGYQTKFSGCIKHTQTHGRHTRHKKVKKNENTLKNNVHY